MFFGTQCISLGGAPVAPRMFKKYLEIFENRCKVCMHLSATWNKWCTAVFMSERVDAHTYKNIKPPRYIWCAKITKFIPVAPKSRVRQTANSLSFNAHIFGYF